MTGNGKMKTYINKSNDEIIKKHIANMNEFCIENIDFEQGKEQLQMIYRYYVKRFSSDEISYKNLIILKDEMSRDVNIGEKYNKNITRRSFNAGRYCNSRFIPFSTVCQISPLTGTDPAPPPRSSGASPAAHGAAARGT